MCWSHKLQLSFTAESHTVDAIYNPKTLIFQSTRHANAAVQNIQNHKAMDVIEIKIIVTVSSVRNRGPRNFMRLTENHNNNKQTKYNLYL